MEDKSLVILLTLLARGGAETQAVHLAVALARQGWSCSVISLLPPRDFQDELAAAGVAVVSMGMRGVWELPWVLPRVVGELRRRRPRVLLTMTYQANVLGKVAGRLAGIPVLVSSIRSVFFGGRFRDLLERATGPLADMTITNSPAVGDALVARGVVPAPKVRVIPNAVADLRADPAARREVRRDLKVAEGAPLWVNVGRLVSAKDQANLLRAFAGVARQDAAARLIIVGEGPLRKDLEDLLRRLKLDSSVFLLGDRRDVPRLLAGADCFVLSSAWEGSPNVLLEAMIAGLPFVTTSVGGAAELASSCGGGIAVPPGNPALLGQAMLDLAGRPDGSRAAMGQAGRRYALQEHGSQRVVECWVRLFHELARERTLKKK